jgi:hypothetical protein
MNLSEFEIMYFSISVILIGRFHLDLLERNVRIEPDRTVPAAEKFGLIQTMVRQIGATLDDDFGDYDSATRSGGATEEMHHTLTVEAVSGQSIYLEEFPWATGISHVGTA